VRQGIGGLFDYEVGTGMSLSCGKQEKRERILLSRHTKLELNSYNTNRALPEVCHSYPEGKGECSKDVTRTSP
jgi:hypothetical protein